MPPSRLSSWDLIVGITGLALCRHVLSGPRDRSRRRIDELRALLAAGDAGWALVPAAELAPRPGYALWAAAYDAPGNPVIGVEQPIVQALLDRAPRGRALDAACGTGRHAAHLAAAGHEVVGVDCSAEMLEVARRRLPGVELHQASIESLPFPDGCFDLAVCALALTHLPSLDRAIAELSRVVRRGGCVVMSDIHPAHVTVLDGQARFQLADGRGGFIRNHVHLHADYLAAFRRSGLDVLDCVEPIVRAEDARAEPLHRLAPEAVTDAIVGLPYVLVWDLARR